MNIEKTHRLFRSSKFLLFVIVFAFIAVQLFPVYSQWNNLSLWGSVLIQIGIAFFLLHLNHTFKIIQEHTFLPALFYLLLIGSNPALYYNLDGSIAALCLVMCYYFLFDSYQKPYSQFNALNISLLLVLGSLLWTPLLLFFPIFWRGFHRFKCFSVRVFFASLTGFIIVYLFIFTWSIFQGDKDIFFSFLPQLDTLFIIHKPDFTIFGWITCGFLFFIYLIIGIYLLFFNISEKVWTISVLSHFYFLTFIIFILLFFQSEDKSSWGLIIFIPIAFLTGHFFSRSNKRSINYLFLLFFLFFVVIGIAQHIGS